MNSTDEILAQLRGYKLLTDICHNSVLIDDAIAEIERLRAAQFRWIHVSEGTGFTSNPIVHWNDDVFTIGFVTRYCQPRVRATHWAPIPPLPEPPLLTQEQKDEELWKEEPARFEFFGDHNRAIKSSFLAGLKAARKAKP